MKKIGTTFFICFILLAAKAQIIAGPMLGQVELRDAKIWLEVAPSVKSVKLQYGKRGTTAKKQLSYKGTLGNEFNPITFTVGGLDLNTTYEYSFIIDGKAAAQGGQFTTKDLWQWRKPVPDFTFLAGSCAYFNEPVYDRPGKPYGGDSSIFETMAKEKAAFMLWLGDNWYTREVDYYSQWGLWNRPHHDRQQPVLQNFLKAMPHYAMWDDHDYGPNDIGSHYTLKETSKKVFDSYWANPSSGHNGEGVYTQIGYGDVDIFMCDDRWWRSADDMKDSVAGKPNPEKTMLGAQQLQWLKNALLYSSATFKIVAVGSQVLNPASTKDKLQDYPAEYYDLVNFITDNKIDGILFMSGDRHHSEVIKVERAGTYPLFDITVSSLTAGTVKFTGPEANSPYRLIGIDVNNYGRISVTGAKGQRKLTVEYIGTKGGKLGEWSVPETSLKTPR
jgi:alkaline phosphatase D